MQLDLSTPHTFRAGLRKPKRPKRRARTNKAIKKSARRPRSHSHNFPLLTIKTSEPSYCQACHSVDMEEKKAIPSVETDTNILLSVELPAEGEREAVQLHLLDPFSALLKHMPESFRVQLSKALPEKPYPTVGGSSDGKPAGKRRKLDGVRPDPWTALAAPASAALRKAWLPANGAHKAWWRPEARISIVHWETEEWTSAPWIKLELHCENLDKIGDDMKVRVVERSTGRVLDLEPPEKPLVDWTKDMHPSEESVMRYKLMFHGHSLT